MSFEALAWAGKCKTANAADKLVLFGLADRHNSEANGAYPSTAWLVEFTSLNRKTVIAALDRLEASGFISDSGERRGQTAQVKLYRLHLESVPKTEPSQKRNSSVFSSKGSQKRDTEPVRTTTPSEGKPSSGVGAKGAPPRVNHEIPEDWEPLSFGRGTQCGKIIAGWPPDELAYQLEHFRAHHGKKGDKFKDWQKAWATWVLNKRGFGNGRMVGNSGQGTGRGEHPGRALLREAEAELALEAEREAQSRH